MMSRERLKDLPRTWNLDSELKTYWCRRHLKCGERCIPNLVTMFKMHWAREQFGL